MMRENTEFKEVKGVGRIPVDWEVKSFLDAVEILDFRGKTPLKLGMKWGGNIPALSANNVRMGYIDFNLPTHYGSLELYNNWMTKGDINKGDIILTTEAPAGNVAIIEEDGRYILSQRVIGIKTDNILINNYFLKYYFMSKYFKNYLSQFATGSTVVGISQKSLAYLSIPIPHIREQEKIAQVLSNVDMNIEKTEQAIYKYKQVKKGLMDDLLTGKVRIKDGKRFKESRFKDVKGVGKIPWDWEVKELDSISNLIDGDRSSNYPKESELVNEGVVFLNTSNIKENKLELSNCKFITKRKFDSLSKGKLQKDDLIITMRGSIGNIVVFDCIYDDGFINAQMCIIRSKDKNYNEQYLYYQLVGNRVQNILSIVSSGSAQPQLTVKDLKSLKIVVPNLDEQQAIVEILSNQDKIIDKEKRYFEKLKKLKVGLMEDLLIGKIRVKLD